jgi:hypothetical protein
MTPLLQQADELLRGGGRPRAAPLAPALLRLAAVAVGCGMLYGAAMGSWGGLEGGRWLQVVYSAVKVPLLLLGTFAMALPSFFVLNTLLGLRSDFGEVLRGLVASQAGLAVVLASLAPYPLLWYASFAGYDEAVLFNGVMFAAASVAAQGLLRRSYRPLAARDGRHRWLLRLWLVLYAFVGIQLGWVLRPFVGYPGGPVQFFRPDTWGNAYLIVAESVWKVLTP